MELNGGASFCIDNAKPNLLALIDNARNALAKAGFRQIEVVESNGKTYVKGKA